MDIRSILDKLDNVMLSEAITLQDVEAAVAGKKDEQERAGILNDLAWKHKLPGLYDPVSGGFVGKQSMPVGGAMGGRYSIAATGSERSDRALADMGLIPDNAKTSTALGRAFRGDDKGQYDQDLRTRSQGAVAQQKYEKFKTENLPKLKDLASQLSAAVEKFKTAGPDTSSSGGYFGLDASKYKRESKIYESLMNEFQDEILDIDLEEVAVEPGNEEIKKLIDQLNSIIAQFDGQSEFLKRDPDTQKELNAIRPQIADAVNAVKAAQEKAKADAEKAKADAEKKTNTTIPGNQDPTKGKVDFSLTKPEPEKKFPADYNKDGSQKSKEERLARAKELLAKANQPKVESVQPESMSELMARIQRIAEGTTINEQLTAAEYKELQTIAAGLKQEFGDDPEILSLTNRALNLPAVWKSDEKPSTTTTTTTDPDKKPDDKKPDDKKTGVADPKVQKVQEQLKALGVDPGPIDGRMGPKTIAGIKAFEKLAGVPETGKITPELEKLLADGKNVIARSKLTQSLTAIEALMTKYKISESVTVEDLETMTEDELRAFVMANIKMFTEAEQMSIMKQFITESERLDEKFVNGKFYPDTAQDTKPRRSATGNVDLPKDFGKQPVDSKGNPIRPDYMGSQGKTGTAPTPGPTPTPAPGPTPTPAPGPDGKASWLDRGKALISKIADKTKAAAMRNPRVAAGVAILSTAAAGFGISKFIDWIKGGDIKMDPADLAELQKHLKVLEEFGKNPEVVKGLPADVQKRLESVLGKLNKLQKVQATAPAQTANSGQVSNTPAA